MKDTVLHFPPEVKFESRLSLSYQIKKYEITFYYENEYFEHYGFVDDNNNVFETFEEGSLQRTKTLIFSIKYFLIFLKEGKDIDLYLLILKNYLF